ncbi:34179_t:CDS:2, partial [Racocetra persica]
ILPVDLDNDEVLDVDEDNVELIEELRENIEEIVNLVTNPEPEEDKSDKDNDSTEMHQVTHNEALSAIDLLEQYLLQQDLCDTTRSKYDKTLSDLQEAIRKLRRTSFKQLDFETFFGLAN